MGILNKTFYTKNNDHDGKLNISYYNDWGLEIKIETIAIIKIAVGVNKTRYYGRYDRANKTLFNPIIDKLSEKNNKKLPKWEFIEINEQSYKFYHAFLLERKNYSFIQANLLIK